jgi:hypothetical protein
MSQDIKPDLSLNPPISRLRLLIGLGEAAFSAVEVVHLLDTDASGP